MHARRAVQGAHVGDRSELHRQPEPAGADPDVRAGGHGRAVHGRGEPLQVEGLRLHDADPAIPTRSTGRATAPSRGTNAALALADYLATDPTGSGDPDFLILGDLNSYRMEKADHDAPRQGLHGPHRGARRRRRLQLPVRRPTRLPRSRARHQDAGAAGHRRHGVGDQRRRSAAVRLQRHRPGRRRGVVRAGIGRAAPVCPRSAAVVRPQPARHRAATHAEHADHRRRADRPASWRRWGPRARAGA